LRRCAAFLDKALTEIVAALNRIGMNRAVARHDEYAQVFVERLINLATQRLKRGPVNE
jgi:hypothetical protein